MTPEPTAKRIRLRLVAYTSTATILKNLPPERPRERYTFSVRYDVLGRKIPRYAEYYVIGPTRYARLDDLYRAAPLSARFMPWTVARRVRAYVDNAPSSIPNVFHLQAWGRSLFPATPVPPAAKPKP